MRSVRAAQVSGSGRGIAMVVLLVAACAGATAEDGTPLGIGGGDGGTTVASANDGGPTKGDNPFDGDDGFDDDDDDDDADGGPPLPDLGPCSTDDDCVLTGGFCLQIQGTCDGGTCSHPPEPAGVVCDDGDACTQDDVCDGVGTCGGQPLACEADHASGGRCSGGVCGDMTCDAGWGNCDDDWANGCETALDTETNCGACGDPCTAGANATADCSTGTCELDCDAPYEDCDGDPSNGCEIPTGVPNRCDAGGLNDVNGCWTAHCGNSGAAEAVNFGTWYCYDCTTCHVPSGGQCQWCSHDTGTWFPADSCACGGFEDLACGP